jgi:hypothetical protein
VLRYVWTNRYKSRKVSKNGRRALWVFGMGSDIRRQFRHEVCRKREVMVSAKLAFRIVRTGEPDDAGQVVLIFRKPCFLQSGSLFGEALAFVGKPR